MTNRFGLETESGLAVFSDWITLHRSRNSEYMMTASPRATSRLYPFCAIGFLKVPNDVVAFGHSLDAMLWIDENGNS